MLLIGIVFFIYGAIRNIVYALLGRTPQNRFHATFNTGNNPSPNDNNAWSGNQQRKRSSQGEEWANWIQNRKARKGTRHVFTDDIGEYVDYEEIPQ